MVRPLIREAEELRILYVFIILDRESIFIYLFRIINYEYQIYELYLERWQNID